MDFGGTFTDHIAPCGRRGGGEEFFDQDDDVVVTQEAYFACGCRRIQHEYHDGAVSRTLVHHDGRILLDELIAAE